MSAKILRRFFLGFMNIHILHHAKEEPFYGSWMIEELKSHGYNVSAGTIYPMLHTLEEIGLIKHEAQIVKGKVRKYYSITPEGDKVLKEARNRAYELFKEIRE